MTRFAATVPPNASRPASTTQANPARSLPTYAVVERICAIPGVQRVYVSRRYAVAHVEISTYGRSMLHGFGFSDEDAALRLEQAVRDAYMAVS